MPLSGPVKFCQVYSSSSFVSYSHPRALCAPPLGLDRSLYHTSITFEGYDKMSQDPAEQNIQMWKVKKLIKSLDSARGCVESAQLRWDDLESYHVPQSWYFNDQSHHTPEGVSDFD